MSEDEKMQSYMPDEWLNFNSCHTVRLKFLWGEATAEIIAEVGGNVCGGDVLRMYTEFDTGLNVPVANPINQQHVSFCADDDGENFREIEGVYMNHPTKGRFLVELEEAQRYLVSVEIIKAVPNRKENDHD